MTDSYLHIKEAVQQYFYFNIYIFCGKVMKAFAHETRISTVYKHV